MARVGVGFERSTCCTEVAIVRTRVAAHVDAVVVENDGHGKGRLCKHPEVAARVETRSHMTMGCL